MVIETSAVPDGMLRRAVMARLRLPPWPSIRLPSACALALLLSCALDVIFGGGPFGVHFALCLAGLAAGVGVLYGLMWQLAFFLVGLLPRRLGYLLWPLLSLGAGARLAFLLGATRRLQGAYSKLAIAVLGVCALGSLLLGGLLCALQPVGPEGSSLLGARRPATRNAVAAVLIGCAAVLNVADRVLYVGLYPIGHFALRMAALYVAMFGLAVIGQRLRLPRLSRKVVLALLLLAAVPLLTLGESAPRTLQAFAARPWPATVLSASRDLLDIDRDGYASLLGGGDCAPLDPRVHPGAPEIPDNGIDDNCAMGDAHRKTTADAQAALPTDPSPLDVVLITIDSLRRDRVGIYDPPGSRKRRLTPSLDAWARRATVFTHAYTSGAWTSLALPSLMRGVYPRRLRWTRFYETSQHRLLRNPLAPQLRPGETPAWLFAFPTTDPHVPLARWLARRGMRTLAVIDDGQSEILRPGTGIEDGFDSYHQVNPGATVLHDDADTASTAIWELAHAPHDKRLFLWVHFFGVHSPDTQHLGTPVYGTSVADRYDHEVRYMDSQLGRLLAVLARRPRTAVFVTADHGEELDRGIRHHGYSLVEQLIRIPLIAYVPGWPVGPVDPLVSLVDLMPTILALTDTPAPGDLDGLDLQEVLAHPSGKPRILLSDTWRFDVNEHLIADLVTAYDGRRKVLFDELGHAFSQFDQTGQVPGAKPLLTPATDPLARLALAYLEDTGGMPSPSD